MMVGIHSLNLLRAHDVPCTVLGAGDAELEKTQNHLPLWSLNFSDGRKELAV